MHRKQLLCFILVCSVCASSAAMEIIHGKLLSHKEWRQGNIAAFFNQDIYESTIAGVTRDSEDVYIKNDIDNVQGITGKDVVISGFNQVKIYNNAAGPRLYTITVTINTCFFGRANECTSEYARSEDVINLDANGSMHTETTPSVIKNYEVPGHGVSVIETSVQKYDSKIVFHTDKRGEFTIMDGGR